MTRKIISTKEAPQAIGPYSQAIQTGNLLFCSGQLGLDPETGELAANVRDQADRAMKNIAGLARAAGASVDSIVKTTIFLKDMADFTAVNEVYGSYFTSEKPARSTVAVAGLPKGGLVEIEAIIAL